MTTEDEFQALLDANPEDHHTRLVFADWLQERNDPRAEGYRALGAMGFVPFQGWWIGSRSTRMLDAARRQGHYATAWLKALVAPDWYAQIGGAKREDVEGEWKRFETRREVEDAVAFAFSELPPERRVELLAFPRGAG